MGKKHLTIRMIAGVFYICGLLFAAYIGILMLKGNFMFNMSGLIICALGVCIPIAIATFLLILTMNEIDKRIRIMNVYVLIIFVFYIMLLMNILFRNGYRQYGAVNTISMTEYFKWSVNYIPFITIGKYVQSFFNDSMNRSIIIENLLGNLLLFAPMGILLPCIFQGLRKFSKIFLTMLIILVGVELAQMFTRTGSCDIDDIILNLLGTSLAYGLWSLIVIQKVLRRIYFIK